MMLDSPQGRLYVLDTNGLIYQMYHGVKGQFTSPDGRPTNAVFGVMRALMDLYDQGAEYLIAAIDPHERTFREELFEAYKSNRTAPPDDLQIQQPMITQVLQAMRIPCLGVAGFEADDVMATLAVEGANRGLEVILCTSDKDCRQLLNQRVRIKNLRKGDELNVEALLADWGVRPEQVVDFQTLVGDSVDNIPGVPGCGPKTATKWLQQYGSLENIIAHADELTGPKLRDAFKEAIANGNLERSRKLVRLETAVPLDFQWDHWRRRDWDGQRLLALCQEFGFRSFAGKVRSTLTKSGASKNAELLSSLEDTTSDAPAARQLARPGAKARANQTPSLFDHIDNDEPFASQKRHPDDLAPVDAEWGPVEYQIVLEAEEFKSLIAKLQSASRIGFCIQTMIPDPIATAIVGIGFCWQEKEACYLPLMSPNANSKLKLEFVWSELMPILQNPFIGKVNHNIKFDCLVLKSHGIQLQGIVSDPMLADYLLHSGERSHALSELTRRYFNHEITDVEALLGKGKKQLSFDQLPVEQMRDLVCERIDSAWRLTQLLEPELEKAQLATLYRDVEIPLITALAEIEHRGVLLDLPFLKKLSQDMEAQLVGIEKTIHAMAGREFNIASPLQMREILFDEMKLPIQKRTGMTNEPSTDFETLEKLAALGHELPKKIIEHRAVSKLKGTYVDALPALVKAKSGRLHTSFNQMVATTGRLSSQDPNLQNVPTKTEQGQQIRQAFIAPPGWEIVKADYSQVELRLLAHFCGDERLLQAFAEDRDVHSIVAAEIFKIPEAEVKSQQRRVAKMVNFGVIYGMSAHGLATRLGIPRKEADTFINAYFSRYPKVLEYQDRLLAKARNDGYVTTLLGRRRRFNPSGIRAKSTYQSRSQSEREAINMEIQGSAADLMKKAILKVSEKLHHDGMKTKLILTVHDELVFESPSEEVKSIVMLVRHEMSHSLSLNVPLKVEVAIGPNWLDGVPIESPN